MGLFVGGVDLQLADIGTLLLQRKQKTVTLTSTVDRKPLKIPSFVVYLIQVHISRLVDLTIFYQQKTVLQVAAKCIRRQFNTSYSSYLLLH